MRTEQNENSECMAANNDFTSPCNVFFFCNACQKLDPVRMDSVCGSLCLQVYGR